MFGGLRAPLSLHKYLYARNSPASLADPTGREPVTACIILIGAAGLIIIGGCSDRTQKPRPPEVKKEECEKREKEREEKSACEKWETRPTPFCGDCCLQLGAACMKEHLGTPKTTACRRATQACKQGCATDPAQFDPHAPFAPL